MPCLHCKITIIKRRNNESAISVMGSMKKSEKRIKAINTMLSCIGKYEANKPVHKEYAAIGWKKNKEKFAERHGSQSHAGNHRKRRLEKKHSYQNLRMGDVDVPYELYGSCGVPEKAAVKPFRVEIVLYSGGQTAVGCAYYTNIKDAFFV